MVAPEPVAFDAQRIPNIQVPADHCPHLVHGWCDDHLAGSVTDEQGRACPGAAEMVHHCRELLVSQRDVVGRIDAHGDRQSAGLVEAEQHQVPLGRLEAEHEGDNRQHFAGPADSDADLCFALRHCCH